MAMAVQNLFPSAKVTIGPWIDNGFYYDFYDEEGVVSEDNLKKVSTKQLPTYCPPLPPLSPKED